MFTVLIYWKSPLKADGNGKEAGLDLEDYDFLFFNAQLQNQMIKRPYSGVTALEQTIGDLNQDTGRRRDWRVILFDAHPHSVDTRDSATGAGAPSAAPDTIRKEWNELLFCLAGKKVGPTGVRLESSRPREIWYLSCWEKGTYIGADRTTFAHAKLLLTYQEYRQISGGADNSGADNDALLRLDVLDVLDIPSLRMCWTEFDFTSGMQRSWEELRLCCILLILTCNEITATFFSSGYLYQIRLEMDQEQFAQYVGQLCELNRELGEQVDKALERYYDRTQRRVPYAEPTKPSPDSSDSSQCPKDWQNHRLHCKDLSRGMEPELDRKLREACQWLYKQLFFSRDHLHKQVSAPVRIVEENSELLLDTAGQAYAQTEMEKAIRYFQQKRLGEDKPTQVEQKLKIREDEVRRRVEERLNTSEHKTTQRILAAMEGMTFAIFGVRVLKLLWSFWCKHPSFLHELYDLVTRGLTKPFGRDLFYILAFLVSACIITVLTLNALKVHTLLADWNACHRYNKNLEDVLKSQQAKQKSIADIMKEMAQYQYHWVLLDRQRQIRKEHEEEKMRLLHHSTVQKNATEVCNQLGRMLGDDELVGAERTLLPEIDFSKEPEQVEYYWLPIQGRSRRCSLNHSGYEVDVIYDFVSGFGIHKTPALTYYREQNLMRR